MLQLPGTAAAKGKVAVKDVVDKTAEDDPDYQRVVKDLQDSTRGGWLVGASERQDLQAIADFKDAEHRREVEVQQAEASEFAKLRSRLEAGDQAARAATVQVSLREKREIKAATQLLPSIKVLGRRNSADGPRLLKKARTTSAELISDVAMLPASRGTSLEVTNSTEAARTNSSVNHKNHIVMHPAVPPAAAGTDTSQKSDQQGGHPQAVEEPAADLQALLGGYASDDSDDGQLAEGVKKDGDKQDAAVVVAPSTVTSVHSLPSAAELLGDMFEEAKPNGQQAVAAQAQAVASSSDKDTSDSDA